MFTINLKVIEGREAILDRVRAFSRKHPEILDSLIVVVPQEFGAKVGDPNAYSGLTLPVCPETRATLDALKKDPDLVLRQIETRNEEHTRDLILRKTEKALAKFPDAEAAK